MNKKSELNIMVLDSDPHIIGITAYWANKDITDAELGLEGHRDHITPVYERYIGFMCAIV